MERFSIRNGMIPTHGQFWRTAFSSSTSQCLETEKDPAVLIRFQNSMHAQLLQHQDGSCRICFTADAPCGILRRKDSSARYNKRTSFSFSYEKDCALRTMTSTPVIYSATAVVSSCWFNSISSVCTRSKNFCLRSSLSCR